MRLAPGAAGALSSFVQGGGALVATYLTGMFDAHGPRDRGELDDLLGVRGMGINQRSGRVGPEAFGGREPVSYFRSSTGTKPFGGDAYGSFREPYRIARVDDRAATAADVLTSDFRLMDGDQFFSWFPGLPESPYLVVRELGPGRTAWFAADPATSLFRDGSEQAGSLLADAIRWAARERPVVEVEAPPTVDASIRRGPDGRGPIHVVLANRTSHDLYATGRPGMTHSGPNGDTRRMSWTRAIVPVAGVRLRFEGPHTSATSRRGATLAVTREGGSTVIDLARLDDLDIITIS